MSRRAFFLAATGAIAGRAMADEPDYVINRENFRSLLTPQTREFHFPPQTTMSGEVRVVGNMAPDLPTPAYANLVLCMDASTSMSQDGDNFGTQVEGTAAALESDNVVDIIRHHGGIGITCLQFATAAVQSVPWAFVKDKADAKTYAAMIRNAGQKISGGTYIDRGLLATSALFKKSPFKARNSVVDVSGDGVNASGAGGAIALQSMMRFLASENFARVNGLAICDKEPHLTAYFKENLITDEETADAHDITPGRVWTVTDMRDYRQVMMQKLMNEIA